MVTNPYKTISPLSVPADELVSWSQNSLRFFLAKSLIRRLPRGKGWCARLLGRTWLRNMKASIATEHGARLAIDPTNLDVYTTIAICLEQDIQWDVLHTCLNVLQPGDVCYDIGANAGSLTIDVAYALRNQNVRFIAFEPQTSLAQTLMISAVLNHLDLVDVYPILLGDEVGEQTLYIPAHSIHASLVTRSSHAQRVTCMQATIDYLVSSGQIPPPDVIKIDVEGAELAVIRGAQQTISEYMPIIIFEADINMQRFDYTLADIIDQLQHYNVRTVHGMRDIATMKAEDLEMYGDYIALPKNGKKDYLLQG
jgi:FkbM family methyltransferase